MTWAADAAGHPDPWALKQNDCLFVGQYVGTAFQHYGVSRGYIDQCLEIGLGVFLIFEEWSSQFLGGYDTAIGMMSRMRQEWDRLGVPNDGSVIPAVALVDPNPAAVYGNEDALRWFTRGVNDACWLPEFTGYASKYGMDVAGEVAPKMTRRWGVGTWGYGEGGGGSLPAYVPADMIQHGNRAAPVGGVDYNTLFREDMGQWGGPHVTPPANTREDDMYIALIHGIDGQVHAYLTDGCVRVHEYTGAPGAYGIPQDALDSGWKMDDLTNKSIEGQSAWDRLLQAEKNALTPVTGGGGGGTITIDYPRIAKDVADEIARRGRE